jgi:predicted DsbA family dithiol-disulfide isomerase
VSQLVIDVFVDIVCPWCLIGIRRLDQALASVAEGTRVTVRHHPFLLDPSTPPEGMNVAERLRQKYGVDPRAGMQQRVEALARSSGIDLDLRKQERMYPTAAAHTLVRHAAARGTQRELAAALFDAYFLEARNIGDPDVLVELATRHGFDADTARSLVSDEAELATTRRHARSAAQAGIDGVPFFVFNQRVAVSGAQPVEVFRDAITRALNQSESKEDVRE